MCNRNVTSVTFAAKLDFVDYCYRYEILTLYIIQKIYTAVNYYFQQVKITAFNKRFLNILPNMGTPYKNVLTK